MALRTGSGFKGSRVQGSGFKGSRVKAQALTCQMQGRRKSIPTLRRIYVPTVKRQPQRAALLSDFHLSSAL